MANPSIQNFPIQTQPFLYVNGLELVNNSTTPSTQLDIEAGQCRDKNNVIDIVLKNAVTLNTQVNGANGLDTGALVNFNWYAVYVIADSSGFNPTATIMALYFKSNPLMPLGYDSLRYIGAVLTDGTASIVQFSQSGFESNRYYQWYTSFKVVNAGASTAFSTFLLTNGAPPGVQIAYLVCGFIAGTAGDIFSIRPFGSSTTAGNSRIELGSAAAGARQLFAPVKVIPGYSGTDGAMQFAVQSNTDSLDIYVNGWEESL